MPNQTSNHHEISLLIEIRLDEIDKHGIRCPEDRALLDWAIKLWRNNHA